MEQKVRNRIERRVVFFIIQKRNEVSTSFNRSNCFTNTIILQDNSTINRFLSQQTGYLSTENGFCHYSSPKNTFSNWKNFIYNWIIYFSNRFRTYSYLKKYSSCWFRNSSYWYCFFSNWNKHSSNWFINFSNWDKCFSYRFSSFSCWLRNFSYLKVKILIYFAIIKWFSRFKQSLLSRFIYKIGLSTIRLLQAKHFKITKLRYSRTH